MEQIRKHFGTGEVPASYNDFFTELNECYDRLERIEQQEGRSESNLWNILNNTSTAYVLLDNEATILSFNPQANELASILFSGTLVLNTSYLDLMTEDRRPEVDTIIRNVIGSKKPYNYEVKYETPQGTEKWLSVGVYPIFRGEDVTGISIGATDFTERKLQEIRLSRQNEQIRELSFTTSHELRHESSKVRMLIEGIKVRMLIEGTKIPRGLHHDLTDLIGKLEATSNHMNTIIFKINDILNSQSEQVESKRISLSEAEEICLVDDDLTVNMVNSKLIGYVFPKARITVFEEIAPALQYIRENISVKRCVFLDINFKAQTGWDFLDRFREIENNAMTSIIILTSSIDPVDYERSKNYAEVSMFQTKPLTLPLLQSLK